MTPTNQEADGLFIARFSGDCDKMYPIGTYADLLKDNTPEMIYPLAQALESQASRHAAEIAALRGEATNFASTAYKA